MGETRIRRMPRHMSDTWSLDRYAGGSPCPESAARWAEEYGRALALWYLSGDLADPDLERDAIARLLWDANRYATGESLLLPVLETGTDLPYEMARRGLLAMRESLATRPHDWAPTAGVVVTTSPFERVEACAWILGWTPDDADFRDDAPEVDVDFWFTAKAPERIARMASHVVDDWVKAGGIKREHPDELAARVERSGLDDLSGIRFERERRNRHGVLLGTPPRPQPYGVSSEGAEQLACDWMRHLGATDVAVTRKSKDGGFDVTATRHVAQVKAWAGPVGVVDVRALVGAATVDGREPLFFATTGYTADAARLADRAGVALFVMDAVAGTLEGTTTRARMYRKDGLVR